MTKALTVLGLGVLLAGCASDPYANRGGTASAPNVMRSDNVNWGTDEQIPRLPGSEPTTHPSDPHAGIGVDDFGGSAETTPRAPR
ncbi:MAG TPA: hypothetical protein VK850_10965 [Candidatus Binatia bacterium]|nr:hypothetical protein [Candidatus Binatia bacterium]